MYPRHVLLSLACPGGFSVPVLSRDSVLRLPSNTSFSTIDSNNQTLDDWPKDLPFIMRFPDSDVSKEVDWYSAYALRKYWDIFREGLDNITRQIGEESGALDEFLDDSTYEYKDPVKLVIFNEAALKNSQYQKGLRWNF